MMRTSLLAAALAALVSADPAGAETVSNPVTGYQVSLFRAEGGNNDFQGWIRLFNGAADAGYVYIQNGLPETPFLGSTKYVVIDIPVAMLGDTLRMLDSGKPIFITYRDTEGKSPSAFLHVGGNALPGSEQAEFVSRAFSKPMATLMAAP
jgi:hypothetical protein